MPPVNDLLRTARARLRRLSPSEAAAAQAAGGVIVNIRADAQRAADGLVPGALVVPRNVLEWRADPVSPDRDPRIAEASGPVVLMCAEGFASSLAAATLQDLGLGDATDMAGGFVAWRAAGLPVERPGEAGLAAHWDAAYAARGTEGVSWFEATPAAWIEADPPRGHRPGRPDHRRRRRGVAAGGLRAGRRLPRRDGPRPVAPRPRRRGRATGRRGGPRLVDRGGRPDVGAAAALRRVARPGGAPLPDRRGRPAPLRRHPRVGAAAGRPRRGGRLRAGRSPALLRLAVSRWTPEGIAGELGLALVEGRRTVHRTPGGTAQPFSWALLRRG